MGKSPFFSCLAAFLMMYALCLILASRRLARLAWALARRRPLGLNDLMLHAGFLPEPRDPDRKPFLDTLGKVSALAAAKVVTVAFETGQETADLLRRTLDDLKCANLKVN